MSSKPSVIKRIVTQPAPAAAPVTVVSAAPAAAAVQEVAVVSAPAPAPATTSVQEVPTVSAPVPVPAEKKRIIVRRPHQTVQEMIDMLGAQLASTAESLRQATVTFRRLQNHLSETKPPRKQGTRTTDLLFDSLLAAWIRKNLTAEELQITRKNGAETTHVDLSDVEHTPVFRTDLTKLYTRIFEKKGMSLNGDRRNVDYSKDPDLVELLTTGAYKPEYEAEVQQIREGTKQLTIFSIQKFFNHRLQKPTKGASATTAASADVHTPAVGVVQV